MSGNKTKEDTPVIYQTGNILREPADPSAVLPKPFSKIPNESKHEYTPLNATILAKIKKNNLKLLKNKPQTSPFSVAVNAQMNTKPSLMAPNHRPSSPLPFFNPNVVAATTGRNGAKSPTLPSETQSALGGSRKSKSRKSRKSKSRKSRKTRRS
jgi:hypothetical protein